MGPDWRQAANMAAFTFPFGFRLLTFLVMITGKRSTLFGEIQGPVCVDGLVLRRGGAGLGTGERHPARQMRGEMKWATPIDSDNTKVLVARSTRLTDLEVGTTNSRGITPPLAPMGHAAPLAAHSSTSARNPRGDMGAGLRPSPGFQPQSASGVCICSTICSTVRWPFCWGSLSSSQS